MASNWIKVEHASPDKPEVVQLAEILSIDQDAAFGKCIRIWMWADQQSVDGNALSVTKAFLDRLVFCNGFADALVQVGWLSAGDQTLSIPNFERHNGQSAKKRAQSGKRVAKHRDGNANVTQQALPKALPDKREIREEDTHTHTHSSGGDFASHKAVHPEWVDLWKTWIDTWEGRMQKRFDPILAEHQLLQLASKTPAKAKADLRFSIDKYAKSILDSDDDFSKRRQSASKPKKERVRL